MVITTAPTDNNNAPNTTAYTNLFQRMHPSLHKIRAGNLIHKIVTQIPLAVHITLGNTRRKVLRDRV